MTEDEANEKINEKRELNEMNAKDKKQSFIKTQNSFFNEIFKGKPEISKNTTRFLRSKKDLYTKDINNINNENKKEVISKITDRLYVKNYKKEEDLIIKQNEQLNQVFVGKPEINSYNKGDFKQKLTDIYNSANSENWLKHNFKTKEQHESDRKNIEETCISREIEGNYEKPNLNEYSTYISKQNDLKKDDDGRTILSDRLIWQ